MAISPDDQTIGASGATRLNAALQARTGTSATFTAQQWTVAYRVLIADDATRTYTEEWFKFRKQVLSRAEACHSMAQEAQRVGAGSEVVNNCVAARDSVAALIGLQYDDENGDWVPIGDGG